MAVIDPPRPTAYVGPDRRDARTTGLAYLGLALTGMLGFLVIRPRIFDPVDPSATVHHLLEHETLARIGIVLELGVVVTQVLTALWFLRLLRPVDRFAAGALAVFGVMNAVAVLGSAAFLASALDVSLDPVVENGSQLMYVVSENLWGVGNVFFGLWLIPMGHCVLRSGWAPRLLGWILVAGGFGYLVGAFVGYLLPGADLLVSALPGLATVGEVWMIGWLLVTGLRGRPPAATAGAGG